MPHVRDCLALLETRRVSLIAVAYESPTPLPRDRTLDELEAVAGCFFDHFVIRHRHSVARGVTRVERVSAGPNRPRWVPLPARVHRHVGLRTSPSVTSDLALLICKHGLTDEERTLLLAGVLELTIAYLEDDEKVATCRALAAKLDGDPDAMFFGASK